MSQQAPPCVFHLLCSFVQLKSFNFVKLLPLRLDGLITYDPCGNNTLNFWMNGKAMK